MQTPKLGYSYTLNIPWDHPDYTDQEKGCNGLLFYYAHEHEFRDAHTQEWRKEMVFRGCGDSYKWKIRFELTLDEFKRIFFLFGIPPTVYSKGELGTHVVLM
jgi:hypothetical protein